MHAGYEILSMLFVMHLVLGTGLGRRRGGKGDGSGVWSRGLTGVAGGFVGVGVLACVPRWTAVTEMVGRVIGVSHRWFVDGGRMEGVENVYVGVAGLCGRWVRRGGYEFADGMERVVVRGPGVGIVVWVVGMVFAVRDVVADGLLVRCGVFVGVVWVACLAVGVVLGRRRGEEEVEEEYVRGEDRARFGRVRSTGFGRSFVARRERDREVKI